MTILQRIKCVFKLHKLFKFKLHGHICSFDLYMFIYIQLFICTYLMVCGFIVYVYFQVEISYATDLFNTHSEKLFFATRWNVNYYRYCFLVSRTYFRINVFRHIIFLYKMQRVLWYIYLGQLSRTFTINLAYYIKTNFNNFISK